MAKLIIKYIPMQQAKLVLFLCFLLSQLSLWSQNNNTIDYQNLAFEHLNIDDGLPSLFINDVIEDEAGFLWFSSQNGLIRYNGFDFHVYAHVPGDTNTLSDNLLNCLLEDKKYIWIGTASGLNRLCKKTGKLERVGLPLIKTGDNKGGMWVSDLKMDSDSNVWIATSEGLHVYEQKSGMLKYIGLQGRVYQYNLLQEAPYKKQVSIKGICFDKKGNAWLGTWGNGLLRYSVGDSSVRQYYFKENIDFNVITEIVADSSGNLHLGSEICPHLVFSPQKEKIISIAGKEVVYSFYLDPNGSLWVGQKNSLKIFTGNGNFRYDANNKSGYSLSESVIKCIYQDNSGTFWISGNGIDFYSPSRNYFFQNYVSEWGKGYRDYVKALFVDGMDNIWCGTFGDGLVLLNNDLDVLKRFFNKPGTTNTLANNIVFCMDEDSSGRLWVGTHNGVSIINIEDKTIERTIRKEPGNKNSLIHNHILDIFHDSRNITWIATREGLNRVDPATGIIEDMTLKLKLPHYRVNTIMEDRAKTLWFGTDQGLGMFNTVSNKPIKFPENKGLGNFYIMSLLEDREGNIWIGTRNGLNKYDSSGNVDVFTKEDGLSGNWIGNMKQDLDGNIWIHTEQGLSKLNPQTKSFINYGRKEGLKTNNSSFYLKDSTISVGGENTGIYRIKVDELKTNKHFAPLYFTSIYINGKEFKEVYGFPYNIESREKTYIFKHGNSSFEFEFALLDYISPEKSTYNYKLEGFDREWRKTTGEKRFATYTNLLPGTYMFTVNSSNIHDENSKSQARFKFKVLSPWWRTKWAIMSYSIFVLVIILLFRVLQQKRNELTRKIEEARNREKVSEEVNEMKLRFFTNISHEIRTPLTLISIPLENVLDRGALEEEDAGKLLLAKNNILKIQNLVEQLLDYRKIAQGKMKINERQVEIIGFLRSAYNIFEEYGKKRNINFRFEANEEIFKCMVDTDILEKIINNLLSNAFKYTPEHGFIELKASVLNDEGGHLFPKMVEISVANSGKGIPLEYLDKIFDRFFQLPENTYSYGNRSGIGLSIVKDYVQVLGGEIVVTSKPDVITEFVFTFPVNQPITREKENEINSVSKFDVESIVENRIDDGKRDVDRKMTFNNDKKLLLIVEDNEELRKLLFGLFADEFHVMEAENGIKGLNIAINKIPDIIISDILMPEMDGIEFCGKCKKHELTSHIPIVLLTAKADITTQKIGFDVGADLYISKPFDYKLLESQIKNLIHSRDVLKQKYSTNSQQINTISTTTSDFGFIRRVNEAIEKNLSNENFNVNSLATCLGMSTRQVYRKFNGLMEQPVAEYIKCYKLNRAAKLLVDNSYGSISEVAYATGYKYTSHFSNAFKKQFGLTPSEFISNYP